MIVQYLVIPGKDLLIVYCYVFETLNIINSIAASLLNTYHHHEKDGILNRMKRQEKIK